MKFQIDITNSSRVRYGDGPILTAQSWETVQRVDQAGTFSFSMPANDPRAALLGKKRHAICYTLIRGVRTQVGEGIIDKIGMAAENNQVMLTVSGDTLMRELTYQRVGTLTIGTAGDPPTTAITGPAQIMALAPAGWSLDVVAGYSSTATAIFHEFDGDTVLAALAKLAELSGEHFRLGAGKTVVWMRTDQDDCGVMAMRKPPADDIVPGAGQAWITKLSEEDDSYSQYSRIYPYGAGEGAARVILNADTTWTPPDADYEINKAEGYIRRISVDNELRVDGEQAFKDVTDTNSLASATYQFLRTHSSVYNSYSIDLVELNQAINPGGTMHARYRRVVDGYAAVDIDADLYILEVTTTLDNKGLRTSGIKASTVDRYAVDSTHMVVSNMMQSGIFSKNKQWLNGADVIGLPGGSQPVDDTLTAISALADAAGDLHNDGAGGLDWDAKGSAAYADVGDFDGAGAAGAVQANLGTHEGLTGTAVHGLGSMSIENDAPSDGSTYGRKNGSWSAVGAGIGDVVGPAGATDGHFAAFDGGTGKLLKDSGFSSASFQPADATLTSLAGLTINIGSLIYGSASDTFGVLDIGIDPGVRTFLSRPVGGLGGGSPHWYQVAWSDLSGVPGTFTPSAHNILSASHGDTTAAAVVRGDVITGQGASPKWTKLALLVPAATFMNYFGVANGDTEPGYKVLFDTGMPENEDSSSGASAGTAVVAARRDHRHAMAGNFTPTAHAIDGAAHTVAGRTAGQVLIATAATTFGWSAFTMSGTGALSLGVTAGKSLTLTSADDYNVTVPATGTVALLGISNTFTVAQTFQASTQTALFRRDNAVLASLLGWYNANTTDLNGSQQIFYGDTTGVGAAAGQIFGNMDIRFDHHDHATRDSTYIFRNYVTGASTIAMVLYSNGNAGFGVTTPTARVDIGGFSTAAGIDAILKLSFVGSGANNDGGSISYNGKSDSTFGRGLGLDRWTWVDSADATRKARRAFYIYDTALREVMRMEASGTAAMLGFFGVAAVARPAAYTQTYSTASRTVPAMTYVAPTGGTTVDTQARASLVQLAADVLAYLKVITSLIDDAQSLGLAQ